MTAPAELATRAAYLEISRDLMLRRYGPNPLRRLERKEGREDIHRRAERDLAEYDRISLSTRRPLRRRRP